MEDVVKEKLNPFVKVYRRINSKPKKTKVVLEYWVFCILQTSLKQEKLILTQFEYFLFF